MLSGASLLGRIVILGAALVTAAVDPVVIKGSHFFYQTNGSEFFIRGVTYQTPTNSTPIDPLSVSLTCMRDLPFLNALTTNVIRVSYIDSSLDHSACMTALATSGIYVMVDLPGTVNISATNPEWNLDIYNAWTQTVDAMAGYSNVLGFFAGNNIVTNISNSPAAAFIKAGVRDMKSYIKNKGYREIPVGYEMSASDNYDVMSFYMACSNSSEAIDFLGISDFNWCSNNTFLNSGYQAITDEYASYPVPVFFADYGCVDSLNGASVPRTFQEVPYIYGTQMTNVVSGGIVFEYFQDDQDKGLVSLIGTSISALPAFTSYSSQIAKITPSSNFAAHYVISNTITPSCPTAAFSASPTLPPVVNKDVCACMMESLTCIAKPGLNSSTTMEVYQGLCGTSGQNCPALHGDGSTGTYGAFSMCNITERLSWALNIQFEMNQTGCMESDYALIKNQNITGQGCWNILSQAGQAGTKTITSLPTSTATSPIQTASESYVPGLDYAWGDEGLSRGAKAGIAVGVFIGLSVVVSGAVWCFWKKRRGFTRQQSKNTNDNGQDSRRSSSPEDPSGLRGGSASIISDDSRGMSELPRFDGSYMCNSWSRSEMGSSTDFPDSPAGRDAAMSYLHSPLSRASDLEMVSTIIPPSPMGSVKEMPAFRNHQEDKSLASMKKMTPMIKVSPQEDER